MAIQQMMMTRKIAAALRLDDSIVAGTDGTLIGYSTGGYAGSSFGFIGVSNMISGGGTLDFFGDLSTSSLLLVIAIGADPGAGYVTDVLIDGVSANAAIGGSIAYAGYSGGYAIWGWPATFGITNGVSYHIQIVP